MAVSISVVLLLLILAVTFLRNGGLKPTHAIVCALLGFYVASSSMAPTIHSGLTATADIVSSLRP
jgi:signal peptidase I